jgi:16S rRNA (cytosine1402-N4)-methyltransferase
MSGNDHVPVLLGPVIEGLRIRPEGIYVDGTFGRGGHSRAILAKLGEHGRLVGIDRDPTAIAAAPRDLVDDARFELIRGECAQLERLMEERSLVGAVDGVLLDVGVSSPQLDEAGRGFSFKGDGPLDMRMDPEHGQSAAEWLAEASEPDLRTVLRKYGEEPMAARISKAIVSARASAPITRTRQLADIVSAAVPAVARRRGRHPATRTFQAIRIHVNDELRQLQAALEQSLRVLAPAGRLCVISFHSLEDRIVKRFMREHARVSEPYRGLPDIPADQRPLLARVEKPRVASAEEISANPRARSARLRIAEKAA